jgi:hypothetical protein
LNRVQEFPLLMDVLLSEKSRVYWSHYRPEKAHVAFTVPGQVNRKEMTLPELLEYLQGRYGVNETHPQIAQVIERFHAEVARQQAEHAAEEAEQQARKERYQQLYAPFAAMSHEDLMDEIYRLRQGEEGQLFRQVLAKKEAEIERLEVEVADLEAKIESHDQEISDIEWKREEAYQFAQQVLKDNEVLRAQVVSLRAAVEPQAAVDGYDETVCYDQDDLDKHDVTQLSSHAADNLGEIAPAAINDQRSQDGALVE